MGPAMQIQKELVSIPSLSPDGDKEIFEPEKKILTNLKKTGLMAAGAAVLKLKEKLKEQQEILMHLADILIEIFVAESALLRADKLIRLRGADPDDPRGTLARIYLYHAMDVIERSAKETIYAFSEGDEQRILLLGLKRFMKAESFNLKEARRKIADRMLEKNEYPF
jgi:hypothetical protein